MWRRGIMAMIILLSTTCRPANITRVTVSQTVSENLLGTPETSRKGRSTLKALSALTSNWSIFIVDKMVLTTLKWGAVRWWHLPYLYQPYHHNSKVQDVPGIPQVSILVLDKSLGYDLHHALARENKQKSVFNFFLKWRQKSVRAVTMRVSWPGWRLSRCCPGQGRECRPPGRRSSPWWWTGWRNQTASTPPALYSASWWWGEKSTDIHTQRGLSWYLKGFFKDKQPMDWWALSGGGLAPTRLAGFLSVIWDGAPLDIPPLHPPAAVSGLVTPTLGPLKLPAIHTHLSHIRVEGAVN